MAYDLKIGGVTVAAPRYNGGLSESYEAVWSANTGRDAAGVMQGTLVTTKCKVKLNWQTLTWAQSSLILSKIKGSGFTTLSFPSIDGTTKTLNGYFGTPEFNHYSWADGLRYCSDISVDFIER